MQYKNRFEKYSINEILSLIDIEQTEPDKIKRLDNGTRLHSLRLIVFKRSQTCVRCGLKASYFIRESFLDENPHLNMYGKNDLCEEVLFTKDHIIPKSKGGKDILSNLQTMCSKCNGEKGNSYERFNN